MDGHAEESVQYVTERIEENAGRFGTMFEFHLKISVLHDYRLPLVVVRNH